MSNINNEKLHKKQVAIMRDPRRYTFYIWGRGSGYSWHQKMIKEAMGSRYIDLKKR